MNLPAVFKSAVQSFNSEGLHVESFHVTTTKDGHRKCEIACHDGMNRKFLYLVDRGFMIERHAYELKGWDSLDQRNSEIKRLYRKEGMTQEFIASVMGLSQSRVSQIVQA